MTDEQTDTTESEDSNDSSEHEIEPKDAEEHQAEPDAKPSGIRSSEKKSSDVEPTRGRRSISVSIRSLVITAFIVILAGAAGAFGWLYVDARDQLDAQASDSASNARAEKLSLDYAVNAATVDFKDLQAWKVKLVAGTSQELDRKLSDAAKSMEQILVPLEWSSTSQPLVAKVRSRADGIIIVDCFVSVQTKTLQAPDPLQSTATYAITIDTSNNWQITDVGGIGSAVGRK